MANHNIETLRLNITDREALEIRREAIKNGCRVNINRACDNLIVIEIIHPDRVIDVTPRRLSR